MSKIEFEKLPKGNLLATLKNEDDEFVMKESSSLNETLSIGVGDTRRVYLSREDVTNILPLLQNFVTFGRIGTPWEFIYKDTDGSMRSKIVYSVTDDQEDAIAEFETNYPDLTWRTIKKLV